MIFEGGVLGMQLGHEGGPLMNGITILIGREQRVSTI